MINTFYSLDTLGSSHAFFLALLIGFGFGFALERAVMDSVTAFLEEMKYENPEQFLDYLSSKVMKKLKVRNGNG